MEFRGIDATSPINRIASGFTAVSVNVRAYLRNGMTLRTILTDAILTVSSAIQTVARLNDSTPAGPVSGYTYILAAGGSLFSGITGALTASASGLSGNPVSMVPFRPNASVQPWMYIADSAPAPDVTYAANPGFTSAGMLKVRSDGLVYKMGIAEPQAAPTVSFPGGTSGTGNVFYRYVYRSTKTGAISNPSPESIPGQNATSNPSFTQVAATAGTINPNISVNATQYEGNGSQIRTKGGVPVGTTTDYIICRNFGFAIPANVNIVGVQIDLNWVGQNAGTGVLANVQLYYLGAALGTAEFVGASNQSFSTDTLAGSPSFLWGANLTPTIVNDSSFGYGVQIVTQLSGGSDRSFVNTMGITVYYTVQDAVITPTPSTDPQVDKIDFYRQDTALANFTYVGTGPNTSASFTDQLDDLSAAANPTLEYDNFEPFPSIDLPRSGTLTAASNVLTSTGGDPFNKRWLPGTIILVGTPQVAYTAVRRPSSTTSWDFTNNDPNVPSIPNGTNLPWNIAEPALAQQPLPYMFGITDNINFVFAVGDPDRPGTLYWCKGGNLDSAPDTNQLEVTDPGEPLVNGAMSSGLGVLASIKRVWIIQPNFFNALATVTGTEGSTWSLQETAINRGLFMPRCIAVEGGGHVFMRVDDGIIMSIGGGPPQSITDQSLYPLFSHEGSRPTTIVRGGVTLYPPDDSQPQSQQFGIQNGFLYYDYLGTDLTFHTLCFHILTMSWVLDIHPHPAVTHAPNEGLSVQGVLVGGVDGGLRMMESGGTEAVTGTIRTSAIGTRGYTHISSMVIEYQSSSTVTLSMIAADEGNGSYAAPPVLLPATTGKPTKYFFYIGPNKWKWAQFEFAFTNPDTQIYLDGCIAYMKPWGSQDAYQALPLFGGAQAGGVG
jgi:hypothetical protein